MDVGRREAWMTAEEGGHQNEAREELATPGELLEMFPASTGWNIPRIYDLNQAEAPLSLSFQNPEPDSNRHPNPY